jgi:hypothetical protein
MKWSEKLRLLNCIKHEIRNLTECYDEQYDIFWSPVLREACLQQIDKEIAHNKALYAWATKWLFA